MTPDPPFSHPETDFARRLGSGSAITELMQDLGEALASGGEDMMMLGGGQPAHIPEVNELWRKRLRKIEATPGQLESTLANYDPPGGNARFCQALADLLSREFGWPVGPENIAVTTGGQTAFFFLFNYFAGPGRHILLPLVPEYIGYESQLTGGGTFRAIPPQIEEIGDDQFKYRIDFDALEITSETAAICASRPTNPTGNVLTDHEVEKLRALAREAGIPLILDNAYGAPFPNVIFEDVQPVWDEGMILTLSLSKLGLPGTRTGLVVAAPPIISALRSMTATVGLANPNLGQAIVTPLLESGKILTLSRETIRPFYQEKSHQAQAWVREAFDGFSHYRIHLSEGALFLWLWFPGLPIASRELYQRLKTKNVLIVPGEAFFFGDDGASGRHRQECLRMTFTASAEKVRAGIFVLAAEVRSAFQSASDTLPT